MKEQADDHARWLEEYLFEQITDHPARYHNRSLNDHDNANTDNYAILRIAPVHVVRQNRRMIWKTIRLELARTAEYPNGSNAHAYVFRVPLDDEGLIEPKKLKAAEKRPVVRRFWRGEPDQSGVVIATKNGWAFSYRVGEDDDESIFRLKDHPLKVGEYITITETDGSELPFKVVSSND